MIDVACLGETMGQLVPVDFPTRTATSFRLHQAGAESNTAIHLARLGFQIEWVSRLGADAVGDRILDAIGAEGVGISTVARDPHSRTGLFLKEPIGLSRNVTYYRTGSAASKLTSADVDRALRLKPRVLHLTGITPALSSSCDEAIAYAVDECRRLGVVSSFDVNYRPVLWPDLGTARERLTELASSCDIVFVGQDEAHELWGALTPHGVAAAIPSAATTVVKDGGDKATSLRDGAAASVPALPVDVVESVGAGDAFAAGWLAGFLRQQDDTTRLKLGHLVARAALTSTDDTGTAVELDALLADAQDPNLWTTTTQEI